MIGVQAETFDSVETTGVVEVVYHEEVVGDTTCTAGLDLSNPGPTFSREAPPGVDTEQVPIAAQDFDRFGADLAPGDFNGDGFSDLAVGVPGDDLAAPDAGAVNVIYGSADGLAVPPPNPMALEYIGQDTPFGIADRPSPGDTFYRVAAGDFNGDEIDDLAVGAPFDNVDFGSGAGVVNIIYGTPEGLRPEGNELFSQNTVDDDVEIEGRAEAFDRFGASLGTGDFDGNGVDDLAVGSREDVGDEFAAGAVNIIYGTEGADGLSPARNRIYTQNSKRIKGVAEQDDRFGFTVVSGDFGGDEADDLVVGVPWEELPGLFAGDKHGIVQAIYGVDGVGLTTSDQVMHQDTDGIKGEAEEEDFFGDALAAADFNENGRDDLAVGVSHEDGDAGAVNVIYGASKLTTLGDQIISQAGIRGPGNYSADIAGRKEKGDHFGDDLAAGDFGLAVGVFQENVGEDGAVDAGAVNLVYGAVTKLTATGNEIFDQGTINGLGGAERGDWFGSTLGTEE